MPTKQKNSLSKQSKKLSSSSQPPFYHLFHSLPHQPLFQSSKAFSKFKKAHSIKEQDLSLLQITPRIPHSKSLLKLKGRVSISNSTIK